MNISDLVIGGMLIVTGSFGFWLTKTGRNEIRGLTRKQFLFGCVIMIAGGAIVAFMQFFIRG
jgi:hypothetical protein